MTTITASLVKELRDKTGAGMMDCKAALTETKGDIEAAVDWLRKKGLSKAAKKAGRIAAEGLIGVTATGKSGAVVEVNSETDFVARNEQFQDMVRNIASLAPQGRRRRRQAAGHDLSRQVGHGRGPRQGDGRHHRREHERAPHGRRCQVGEGVVADYVHNKVADGLGKIGVLVALESQRRQGRRLAALGRQLAMHIAAANPARSTSPTSSTER